MLIWDVLAGTDKHFVLSFRFEDLLLNVFSCGKSLTTVLKFCFGLSSVKQNTVVDGHSVWLINLCDILQPLFAVPNMGIWKV